MSNSGIAKTTNDIVESCFPLRESLTVTWSRLHFARWRCSPSDKIKNTQKTRKIQI